ncbi:hypothetical protein DSM112329_05000 [Paraconexibacter sp. AEG42_29]|uniref:Uncharacterized protein n=1 Tax=Paraconexibacter sp. AEG42_29 TaxID=2997339 RepID=A0AAU7B3H7_9ACTN
MTPDLQPSTYDQAAQDFLAGETVLAATGCVRAGRALPDGLDDLHQRAVDHHAEPALETLPEQFLLAVTDADVVILKLPTAALGTRPRAVGELLRVPRAAFGIASGSRLRGGSKLRLQHGQDTLMVQSTARDLSQRVLQALGAAGPRRRHGLTAA